MTNLNFMEVFKIRERFVVGAMEQAENPEIMGKVARALVRIQDEMQEQIDRSLLHPSASSKAEKDDRSLTLNSNSGWRVRWRLARLLLDHTATTAAFYPTHSTSSI